MLIKSFFAGFGGQGVLMMGYALAYAGMKEGKHVTFLPAYGAEMRGGTANCTVVVSDEEVASPVASSPEFVVAMNNPSLIKFQNAVQSGGGLFLNSTLVDKRPVRGDIDVFEVPATKIAEGLGDIRSANMIMLGAFIKESGIVEVKSIVDCLKDVFGPKKVKAAEASADAVMKGYKLLEGK